MIVYVGLPTSPRQERLRAPGVIAHSVATLSAGVFFSITAFSKSTVAALSMIFRRRLAELVNTQANRA
jgi:hypothetical protein